MPNELKIDIAFTVRLREDSELASERLLDYFRAALINTIADIESVRVLSLEVVEKKPGA